ncbi:CBS domain-containing protein [Congregibacter litoralis]|uniref:Putative signal-transduction protein n=1 Tax=Congregibacter litoralis KT71 TaxID=314285 RepID=A4ADP3_9GAMM|nr:CBS domain-containing protein [Congregibacter litoralis]EAQ95851.2 putative signal-transduction protein [Congregibacter litoralis KT71]
MPAPNSIKDCMRRNPLTINSRANLVQAVETLVEYKLTGVTVVDDDGNPVGVLSELDCIKSVLAAIYNDGDPEHSLVQDAMTSSIVSCTPGDSIVEVAADMLATRQRRRPVIENGRLVGQVSSSNVLWALMENSRRRVLSKDA